MKKDDFKPIIIGPGPADSDHVNIQLAHGARALVSPNFGREAVDALNTMVEKVYNMSKEDILLLNTSKEADLSVVLRAASLAISSKFKSRGKGSNLTPPKKKRKKRS